MNRIVRSFSHILKSLCIVSAIVGTLEAMDVHRVAILGWGSLIWDPGVLKKEGDFVQGGPTLPIAFSRVSSDGRLTLVIDPVSDAENRKPKNPAGRDVETWYATSSFQSIAGAIDNLREREGTTRGNIGFVNLADKTFQINELDPRTGDVKKINGGINIVSGIATDVDIVDGSGIRRELVPYLKGIIAWASHYGFDAVIWTDLQRNFHDKTGKPFNRANAASYLRSLPGEARLKAREYIEKTPENVLNGTRDGLYFLGILR